ncbi:MAG: hypothetical protein AB7P07_06240 [Hyphomonadaceae bacterium]
MMQTGFRRLVGACAGVAFILGAMWSIQYHEQIAPRVERLADHAVARSDMLVRVSALAAIFWR